MRAASRERNSSDFSVSTRLGRAAAGLLICTSGILTTSCKKEEAPKKIVEPIGQCSVVPLRASQATDLSRLDINRRRDGMVAPLTPSGVTAAMEGSLLRVEYGSGETKKVATGVIVEVNGVRLILSAASILASTDPTHVPNLRELSAIDSYGNRTGITWARYQSQVGGAPGAPTDNLEQQHDINLLMAVPDKSNIGSVALPLVKPNRGVWEVSSGYLLGSVDSTLLPSIRLYTGINSYGSGTALGDFNTTNRDPRPEDIGGPTVQYEQTPYGVTGIINNYTPDTPSDELLEERFRVRLGDGVPQGRFIQTTSVDVIWDALRICGPGIVPTPTP